MGLQASKERNLRILGSFLIVVGFLVTIFLDFSVLNNIFAFIFDILTILIWLFIVISFKLEVEVIVEHSEKLIMPIIIYSIAMITAGAASSNNNLVAVSFILLIVSNIFCLLSWHFSLSIYKKEKKVFLITSIGYIIITIIIRMIILWNLIPFLLFLIGFILIIYSENNMRKKGLLNYI